MKTRLAAIILLDTILLPLALPAADPLRAPFAADPDQASERTCFQTSRPWSPVGNLRGDVALVYGIDSSLPSRIETWRDAAYRIHVMTGVAWGNYQDYFYGRWDGIDHQNEAQTERDGHKIGHGGDVYYMCPGTNYGKYLCVGVQRALDNGAQAIHLEEPEFWDRAGYSEGFKREWRAYYHEDWQPPDGSVDAHWRSSNLKYFLYRRALQQVFDYVQAWNRKTGRHVRCYVPTHSLLNYSQWGIVSPESSLAMLDGCSGYIAQVWTGTSREPNTFRGEVRSRTFETAFLEYGAMQNLVRSTGRSVWYLNDPIEDNPNHDWEDYRVNWESTLTASLFQPEVSQYEIAPWPERIFGGRYPRSAPPQERKPIPPLYATELQTVFNALNDLAQSNIQWDCGTTGIGVLVSDSLMFERGEPTPSDPRLGNVYGLAMPLLKRGLPVTPIQLENVTVPHYLDSDRVLFLSYDGQKPLHPEVHDALAAWVRAGGALVVVDKDADPYNAVREWWNTNGLHFLTPRTALFQSLGLDDSLAPREFHRVGSGGLIWLRERPSDLSQSAAGATQVVDAAKLAAQNLRLPWRESNHLLLRRGPYLIAAGLDESIDAPPRQLHGRFVNLFDPELRTQTDISVTPNSRYFLMDLDKAAARHQRLLASAGRTLTVSDSADALTLLIDGVGGTPGLVLLESPRAPKSLTFAGQPVAHFNYAAGLLRVQIPLGDEPSRLVVNY